MLKILGWILKLGAFAALVLVMGSLIKWNGKTISDQLKTQLSSAERSETVSHVKGWAGGLIKDSGKAPHSVRRPSRNPDSSEDIPSSERQKLRQLIRELNGD